MKLHQITYVNLSQSGLSREFIDQLNGDIHITFGGADITLMSAEHLMFICDDMEEIALSDGNEALTETADKDREVLEDLEGFYINLEA